MKDKLNWTGYLVELIIVIIGITSAFWLNNLAAESRERKLEISFISELKSDLLKDSIRLSTRIRQNEEKIETLTAGLQLLQSDIRHIYADSLVSYLGHIGNYNFFIPENFTLTSMLQSGDIKVIRSNELKKELLRLLRIYDYIEWNQNNLLQALDDNYFPMILGKIDAVTGEVKDVNFLYSIHIKNYCAFTINDTGRHLISYRDALKQIRMLLDLMEKNMS